MREVFPLPLAPSRTVNRSVASFCAIVSMSRSRPKKSSQSRSSYGFGPGQGMIHGTVGSIQPPLLLAKAAQFIHQLSNNAARCLIAAVVVVADALGNLTEIAVAQRHVQILQNGLQKGIIVTIHGQEPELALVTRIAAQERIESQADLPVGDRKAQKPNRARR